MRERPPEHALRKLDRHDLQVIERLLTAGLTEAAEKVYVGALDCGMTEARQWVRQALDAIRDGKPMPRERLRRDGPAA